MYLKSPFCGLFCDIIGTSTLYHSSADDTQRYATITKDRESDIIERMRKRIAEIKIWMTSNMTNNMLNDELFVFTTQRFKCLNIHISNVSVQVS